MLLAKLGTILKVIISLVTKVNMINEERSE